MSSKDTARKRLLEAARAEPSPVRREVRREELGRLLLGFTVGVLLLVALGGVHARVRPEPLVLGSAAVWGTVAALATVVALRRGRTMLGLPRPWLALGMLAVIPLLGASWFCVPWPALPPGPHDVLDDALCFVLTLALAAGPLVAFVGLRREGDPVHPGLTGGAMGVAAGAWGAMLIDLHCETVQPGHVVLGHLVPGVAAMVVGAAWAKTALAVRREA